MSIFHLGQHHEVYNAADIGEFDVSAFCNDVEQAGDVANALAHCMGGGGRAFIDEGVAFSTRFLSKGLHF